MVFLRKLSMVTLYCEPNFRGFWQHSTPMAIAKIILLCICPSQSLKTYIVLVFIFRTLCLYMNANYFKTPGSFAGTIEYGRSACRCLWYSCDWIHTPTRLEFSPVAFKTFFSHWGHSIKINLLLQVHGTMYLKSLLYCT
jgi:hypothetical protein